MGLRRAVSGGLVDSAAASFATFVIGVYAARALSASELGIYALFFSAMMLATAVPSYVLLRPAEVSSIRLARHERLGVLRNTAPVGLLIAGGTSMVAMAVAAAVTPGADGHLRIALAISGFFAALLWPFQDHLRQLLHMADSSGRAATASVLNLCTTIIVIAAASFLDIRAEWIPLSAISLGNVTSFLVIAPCWPVQRADADTATSLRSHLQAGKYYLAIGAAPTLATFAVSALIVRLASSAALGYAEAARVVAQPVLVVATGLGASIGPRSIASGAHGDRRDARRMSRIFIVLLTSCGVLAVATIGHSWFLNPLSLYLPQAYVVPGLTAATMFANIANGAALPYRGELLGAQKESTVARTEVAAALGQSVGAVTAAAIGAYARPLAFACQSFIQLLGHRIMSDRASFHRPSDGIGDFDARACLEPARGDRDVI